MVDATNTVDNNCSGVDIILNLFLVHFDSFNKIFKNKKNYHSYRHIQKLFAVKSIKISFCLVHRKKNQF